MSGKAVSWAFRQFLKDPRCKLVLLALAEHYNDQTQRCDPGQERLAHFAECSVSTIRRQLAKLESAGHIKRQKRGGKGGGRQSDAYELMFSRQGELGHRLPAIAMHGSLDEEQPITAVHVATGHSYARNKRSQLCTPNRKRTGRENRKSAHERAKGGTAVVVANRNDLSSRPISSFAPGSLPTPQSPPPVFEGACLVVTAKQHADWQRMYPGTDLARLYPIVDGDCREKGRLNGAALAWAQKKLGYLINDEQREAQRRGKYAGPIVPPWELSDSVTGDAREDAINAYFATVPGYTGRG
jgi:hypothetical protein